MLVDLGKTATNPPRILVLHDGVGLVSEMLDVFYDECAAAIWENDGLLNKTIGDGIMAIFNFPIPRANHPEKAVLAARSIQRRC